MTLPLIDSYNASVYKWNGQVSISKQSSSTVGLPPAGGASGLVAVDTIYGQKGAGFKSMPDRGYASLPNSGSHDTVQVGSRHANSAPTWKSGADHQGAARTHLPKINTLVNGPLQQQATYNNELPFHYKRGQGASMAPRRPTVAGLPTKPQATPGRNKFATSWAHARVDHVVRGDDVTRHEKETKERQNVLSPTTKVSGQDSGLQTSETHAKLKPVFHQQILPQLIERKKTVGFVEEIEEDKQTETATGSSSNQIKVTRRMAPRRERTRQIMKKARTMLLRNQPKRTLSHEKDKDGDDERETYGQKKAVKIYVSDAIARTRSDSKKSKTKTVQSDNAKDMNSNIPPWHRGEYVLKPQEAKKYKEVKVVYHEEAEQGKETRQKRFFEQLEQVQDAAVEQKRKVHQERMRRKEETQRQQMRQLYKLRARFEEEQVTRFRSQYVTSRVLTHERCDRHVYGLPETLYGSVQREVKLKPKSQKPKTPAKTPSKSKKERFAGMFDVKTGPSWDKNAAKPPKIEEEGIHFLMVDENDQGDSKKQRVDVKDIMADAQKMLEENEDIVESSPRRDKPAKANNLVSTSRKGQLDSNGGDGNFKTKQPNKSKPILHSKPPIAKKKSTQHTAEDSDIIQSVPLPKRTKKVNKAGPYHQRTKVTQVAGKMPGPKTAWVIRPGAGVIRKPTLFYESNDSHGERDSNLEKGSSQKSNVDSVISQRNSADLLKSNSDTGSSHSPIEKETKTDKVDLVSRALEHDSIAYKTKDSEASEDEQTVGFDNDKVGHGAIAERVEGMDKSMDSPAPDTNSEIKVTTKNKKDKYTKSSSSDHEVNSTTNSEKQAESLHSHRNTEGVHDEVKSHATHDGLERSTILENEKQPKQPNSPKFAKNKLKANDAKLIGGKVSFSNESELSPTKRPTLNQNNEVVSKAKSELVVVQSKVKPKIEPNQPNESTKKTATRNKTDGQKGKNANKSNQAKNQPKGKKLKAPDPKPKSTKPSIVAPAKSLSPVLPRSNKPTEPLALVIAANWTEPKARPKPSDRRASRAPSYRRDLDSVDLMSDDEDDDDIFEKALRKYGITLDSDED